MQILSFSINGFGHLDVFSHQMKDGNIFHGDHGAGKTEVLLSVMSVLSGKEYSSIDDPITKGKNRHENVVNLKVESGDEITMMDHVFKCEVGDNITVSLVKTKKGNPKLLLFNTTTNKPYVGTTTETRKIVDRFLGRFPDPKKLDDLGTGSISEREKFVKTVAQMSKTKEGEPIDFSSFIEREIVLREEHSTQKTHLKVLGDDQASMPVPQDGWATKPIDQKAVSDEIQRYNGHEKENTKRLQSIQEVERRSTDQQTVLSGLNEQKIALTTTIDQSTTELNQEKKSIESLERMIVQYKDNNPILEPEDTEELARQIEALQKKLKDANDLKEKNQKIAKTISDQQNKVTTRKQLADQSEKVINEKKESLAEIQEKTGKIESEIIPQIQAEIAKVKTDNQPIPWEGQGDPEETLEVLPYLNKQMFDAVIANEQVADREKYEEQTKKIESTEKQMKEATESINQVKEDERLVIEASVFPHPDIQIRRDDKNKVDVWIKDNHGVWITYNDGNHAHRMFHSVNIVTHGAGGDLKLLVVREGYALFEYMQKLIIEAANRKGFKVMLETLTSSDKNAIYLGESKTPQKIVSSPLPVGEKVPEDMPAWGGTK